MENPPRITEREFKRLLKLLGQRGEHDEAVINVIKEINGRKDISINAKAEWGGPKVNLDVKTKTWIVNLLVDLRTKITVSIFKKFDGKKN